MIRHSHSPLSIGAFPCHLLSHPDNQKQDGVPLGCVSHSDEARMSRRGDVREMGGPNSPLQMVKASDTGRIR